MTAHALEKRIERIKRDIAALGPLRPGTLYERYSVCGKAGCRCARKRRPQKHGPYHYLSYTLGGRSHTEFVPAAHLSQTRKEVKNYIRLMELVKALVDAGIELSRLRRNQ